HFVCITQPDHALLAGRLLDAWCGDGLPLRPTRAQVITAAAQHDAGWTMEDAVPWWNPTIGGPFDFVTAPLEVRQGLWPRAIEHLAARDAYVGALVAQHALTVYRRYQHDPAWQPFFPPLERLRDDLFATAMDQAAA